MKILNVIASLDPRGGGPIETTKQLSRILAKQGHRADIASLDPPSTRLPGTSGLRVHLLGPSHSPYMFSPRALRWLYTNVANYDAVLVRGIWQFHSLAAWLAARKSKVPYFVFVHGMLDPYFKQTYPAKHVKKELYWLAIEHHVLRDASAVLFTSMNERCVARKSFWPYSISEKVVSYGTAMPPEETSDLLDRFYQAFPHLEGKRILLFLGRIHPIKGCDILIRAFASVSAANENFHLVMAGPDQVGWGSELKELTERLEVSQRVTWTGMLTGDKKWGAFYASEAFIAPSHLESFGIAVTEALACGKPVLISNKVGIWREVAETGAGFVSKDTLGGTIHNIRTWLSASSRDYGQLCSRARECYTRHFTLEKAATDVINAIRGNQNSSMQPKYIAGQGGKI